MSKPDVPPNITALDVLRALYQELSAPFVPYFITMLRIAWRDGSPDTEIAVTHDYEGVPKAALDKANYRGAKSVTEDRHFVEETCGSLYAPVSTLGYRSFDYSWALAFKIDCDLAREKTGDPLNGAAHYISDIAADDKILHRRSILVKGPPSKGRPSKTNTEDLEERYLKRMKNLTIAERKEITTFLERNRKKLDESNDLFRHEDFLVPTERQGISISAGPDDLDEENFLSWLLQQADSRTTTKKLNLDEMDSLNYKVVNPKSPNKK